MSTALISGTVHASSGSRPSFDRPHQPKTRVEDISVGGRIDPPKQSDDLASLYYTEGIRFGTVIRWIAAAPCSGHDVDWNCGPCEARRALVQTGNLDGIWNLFRFLRELVRDLGPCESCESRPAVAVVGGGAAAEFRVCERCAAEDAREAGRG